MYRHADHALGLVPLLAQRAACMPNAPPLMVVGPHAVLRWLQGLEALRPFLKQSVHAMHYRAFAASPQHAALCARLGTTLLTNL